jgi:cytidylate kinase
MKMIITIGGPIGSGKSTVASAIAKSFGFLHVSAGTTFRELAKEKGFSLEEFSSLAINDPSFDKLVDEKQMSLAKKGNAVVDGRLSGRLIDGDIKIWLTAPLDLRVKRVANRENKDLKQARREIVEREKSEATRYKKIYNIDLYDISNYDIVLNTEPWDAEGVIKIIETSIKARK